MQIKACLLVLLSPLAQALEINKPIAQMSCSDVLEIAKASGCAQPVQGFLEGAQLSISLSLKGTNITIDDKDSERRQAHMTSMGIPSPGLSLQLAPSFFGASRFGWSMGFTYDDSYALEQRIRRGGQNKDVDLGTYLTTTVIAAEPSLFYQWGDERKNVRSGFGLALGYASLRGNAYLTEDKNNDSCYQAGSDLFDGGSRQALELNCEKVRFNERRLASGAAVFISSQINRWQFGVSATTLAFHKGNYKLSPSIFSFDLSYNIPL